MATLPRQVDFVTGTPVTSSWLNRMEEMISGMTYTIKPVIQSPTSVRVPGGSGPGQAAVIAINGKLRYNEANADIAFSGGDGAGTYGIFVVTGSDPAFTLAKVSGAGTPAVADYRKIATVDWSGSALSNLVYNIDLQVQGLALVDASVTGAKLADVPIIGTSKLIDAGVTAAKLATNAVATAAIQDASVTAAKFAPGAIGTVAVEDGSITTAKLADSAVTSAKIADGTIVNADVSGSAAIVYSKLNLGNSIVNADVAGGAAIARSKLDFGSGLVTGDLSATAGILKSQLASLAIADADVSAISQSKITNLVSDLAAKAADSTVVHLAGAETITGSKTLADAVNLVLGTATGSKIGTATSQKLGFFNATPVVQRGAPSTLQSVITALSDLGLAAVGTAALAVTDIPNTTVTYAKLNLAAGDIPYSKLALTGAILNADLAGSITYAKLNLAAGDIPYSKLTLTGAILNADLAGSIAQSKITNLTTDLAARALAATVFTAGAGLTGTGDLSAGRTFAVGANADGTIVVNADDIAVGTLGAANIGGGAITNSKLSSALRGRWQVAAEWNFANGFFFSYSASGTHYVSLPGWMLVNAPSVPDGATRSYRFDVFGLSSRASLQNNVYGREANNTSWSAVSGLLAAGNTFFSLTATTTSAVYLAGDAAQASLFEFYTDAASPDGVYIYSIIVRYKDV